MHIRVVRSSQEKWSDQRDCVLCYAEARTVLPKCYPYNGGRIFLDGCFMRSENYSFYEEFRGPNDTAVCGNTTKKSSLFEASARQAVLNIVRFALSNRGYARAQGIEYWLSDCWRSLNESSCRQCLENASDTILGCLPWSEGRALNTGCFMRYSDTDFLNKELGSGSSRGTIIVIVVSVVSSLVVLVVGGVIGFYIWKHKYILVFTGLQGCSRRVASADQYNMLASYKNELLRSNPGSTVEIKTEMVGDVRRFHRLYICLEACKRVI
ncbi:hypothetical protein ACLB2K_053325 [Fragaria x ananassa]